MVLKQNAKYAKRKHNLAVERPLSCRRPSFFYDLHLRQDSVRTYWRFVDFWRKSSSWAVVCICAVRISAVTADPL